MAKQKKKQREEIYTDENGCKVEIDEEGNVYLSKEKVLDAHELEVYVKLRKYFRSP